MKTWEELRDLADKIDRTARNHSAYSMVYEITRVTVDHIRAVARVHELNDREERHGRWLPRAGDARNDFRASPKGKSQGGSR